MNKRKLYETPTMQVVQVQMTQILCASGTEASRDGYSNGNNDDGYGWE